MQRGFGIVSALVAASTLLVSPPALAQSNQRIVREAFDRAAALEQQAARELKDGNNRAARQLLEQALVIYRSTLSRAPGEADAAIRIATIMRFLKRCAEAVPLLEQAARVGFGLGRTELQALEPSVVAAKPAARGLLIELAHCRIADGPDDLGFTILDALGNLSPELHFLAGRRYLQAKRHPSALKNLLAYLRHHPQDLKTIQVAANLQLRLGHLDDAALNYQAVLAKHPSDLNTLKNLAVVEVRRSRFPQAINALKRVLQITPDDVAAHFNLGVSYGRVGQHVSAVEHLQRVVQANPKLVRGWYRLGQSHFALRQHRESLDAFATAIRYDSNHIPSYLEAATVYRSLKQNGQCIRLTRTALTKKPDAIDLLLLHGGCLRDAGRTAQALSTHQQAIKLEPKNGNVHAEVARDYQRLGRLLEAAQAYRTAFNLRPSPSIRDGLAWITSELGAHALQRGRIKKAGRLLDESLKLRPKDPVVVANRGLVHLATGQLDAARARIAEAYRGAPRSAGIAAAHARFFLSDGRTDDAYRILQNVPESRRNAAGYLHLLGLVRLARNEITQGVAALARAHRLRPRDARLSFDYGRSLLRAGRPKAADKVLRPIRDSKLSGVSPELRAAVFAWSAYRGGDFPTVIALLNRAPSKTPERAQMLAAAWAHQGMKLADKKRFTEAKAAFQKAALIRKDASTHANLATLNYLQGQRRKAYRIWKSIAKGEHPPEVAFNIAAYIDNHLDQEATAYRWYRQYADGLPANRRKKIDAILERKRALFGFEP